jgi:hypothetical protein
VPCSSFVRLEVGTVLTLCTARTVTFHKKDAKDREKKEAEVLEKRILSISMKGKVQK